MLEKGHPLDDFVQLTITVACKLCGEAITLPVNAGDYKARIVEAALASSKHMADEHTDEMAALLKQIEKKP